MAAETNPIASQPSSVPNIAIPNQFSSNAFTPATTASQIGHLNSEERENYRGELLKLHENLGKKLADRVPAWPEFRAIVESLSSSLLLTQQATALTTDVRGLARSANETARPQITIEALNDTERIASNLRLLEEVKSVAEQMRQLKEREARALVADPFPSHGHSMATIFENSVTRSSALDPRSLTGLQLDYVARAKEIATISAAAFQKRLLVVEALDPVRKEIEQRLGNMREELEKLLLQGIFGVPECPPTRSDYGNTAHSLQQKSNVDLDEEEASVGKSFLPALPLFPSAENRTATPSPVGFGELCMAIQDALPQIVQALDILRGAGHACRSIEKVTAREAQAVIEHAIQTELQIAKASSTSNPYLGKTLHVNTVERNRSCFFRKESPSVSEKICCAILNRICFHFIATLRRIVTLGNSLQRESINLFSAIVSIREQMEQALIFVSNTFLGTRVLSGIGGNIQPDSDVDIEQMISLLAAPRVSTGSAGVPVLDRDSGSFNPRYSTMSDMERRSSKVWNIGSMRDLAESIECSIFNFELMHLILKRFSRECERLLAPWTGFGQRLISQNLSNALDQFLHHITETYVQTLQRDLRLYVRGLVGKRAGSLLQPPPAKSRTSQTEHKPSNVIPPPPHVEPVAHAIAVCLRVAISIPDIAGQIGSIISSEVLMNLVQRSKDALKLAGKWTDAGCLFQEGLEDLLNLGLKFQGNTCRSGFGINSRPHSDFEQHTPSSSAELSEIDPIIGSLTTVVQRIVNAGSDGPTLLSQSEWKAVVRLIQGLNSITSEIQKWSADSKLSQCCTLDASLGARWSALSVSKNSCVYPLQQLRQRIRQGTTGTEIAMLSTVCVVLGRMECAMEVLDTQVVTPAVCLLRAEIMLRCYWLSVRSLREIETAYVPSVMSQEGSPLCGEDVIMEDYEEVEDDETSSRLYEFDEYGDRIPQSSNSIVKDCFAENVDGPFVPDAQSLTIAENRMVEFAREANVALSMRFHVAKSALPSGQQDDIFSGVDLAIAAGLRNVRRRDRAIAVASRILVQTLALEEENLVGDRTSEQCRALMYESGML